MIYFDSASSTLPCLECLEAFHNASVEEFANPASAHAYGRIAGRKLDEAKKEMLRAFGVESTHELILLSGATESTNLAVKGVAFGYANRGKKILIGATEHPAVMEPCRYLAEKCGFEIVVLPVNAKGCVEPETLANAMDKDVILVSIMSVNNETGAINDIPALAKIVHQYPKAFFHSDMTQSVGKMPANYGEIDLFSFSAHKFHGVKGVGALVKKKTIKLLPSLHGGGQEYGFRSGTEPMPLAVSMAASLKYSLEHQEKAYAHVRKLWDAMAAGLAKEDVVVHSTPEGLPYVLKFSLPHHKASVIMEALSEEGIYVSTLAACSTKTDQTSYVLLAMGVAPDLAANAIRVSFDESNTLEEVEFFLKALHKILEEVHRR